MKKLLTPLLICGITSSLLAGGTSGGPWANGAYYSGYLNGKYMGVVTGNNIAGVLGFGISDGAPPFRTADTQSSSGGNTPVALANSQIRPDVTQNYFVIFVEGRTYSGLTTAGIDIASETVAGALQGTDPVGMPAAVTGDPGPGNFAFNASDALSIIDRGLNGGFTAKVKSQGAVFTFKGDGQLSTPANAQSYQIQAAVIPNTTQKTNEIITGIYKTDTTPFQVKGIRTSYTSFSLQGSQDQSAASAGTSATTGGN
jgi:hypothetical protein